MKLIKQGAILSILLLAGCASTEVKQTASKTPSMSDADIKTLMVGKTIVGNKDGTGWTTVVNADGTVQGTYGANDTDKGKYTIKDGLYCSKWRNWASGNKRCWAISKRANGYYGKSVSGGGDSFKFTMK